MPKLRHWDIFLVCHFSNQSNNQLKLNKEKSVFYEINRIFQFLVTVECTRIGLGQKLWTMNWIFSSFTQCILHECKWGTKSEWGGILGVSLSFITTGSWEFLRGPEGPKRKEPNIMCIFVFFSPLCLIIFHLMFMIKFCSAPFLCCTQPLNVTLTLWKQIKTNNVYVSEEEGWGRMGMLFILALLLLLFLFLVMLWPSSFDLTLNVCCLGDG